MWIDRDSLTLLESLKSLLSSVAVYFSLNLIALVAVLVSTFYFHSAMSGKFIVPKLDRDSLS